MWGKELKKEGGKKEAGLEWNLFQSSSEIKTVTLPLHWIILKMDIISNFFWGGDLKTLTSRKCPTDSQAELQYSVPYGTEKSFLTDIQWQIFLLFYAEVKSQSI